MNSRRWGIMLSALVAAAAAVHAENIEELRQRFVSLPTNAGTVTMWWLNGRLSKEQIREQMFNLRYRDGFAGVAPLALIRFKPATEPAYLSEEYFDMYGCILDTAKELGMTVVFYDDSDFPSGTAGNQMAERYPDDLLKYLARVVDTVEGPREVVLPVPTGALMSVVAKHLVTGERRVVTAEVKLEPTTSLCLGGRLGIRQAEGEEGRFEFIRVLDEHGRVLFEDRFDGSLSLDWDSTGTSRIEPDGLHAMGCLPMVAKALALPARFTIESRVAIIRTAAALAFGVRDPHHLLFWQFNAHAHAIRPHLQQGGSVRALNSVAYPFVTGRVYDVKLVVNGETVETWINGQRIAEHALEPAKASAVRWAAPAGRWEVQAFVCATAPRKRRFVDYLNPESMKKFLELTYDRFAQKFPTHWGSTVHMTFYDDLSTYHVPDCLVWTPTFNEKFQKRFGRSPEPLYPALWEDIGPDTAAARANLWGLRNELLAAGYPRAVQEWCARFSMLCSGHPAAAYRPNPLQTAGDAILWYKYQGAPLVDYIHYFDHGIDGFKIPVSAAYNFDRTLVVGEIFGNFHPRMPNDSNMLYRAAMEVYARGINYLIVHGTWWDATQVRIVPEISWRNPTIGPELPRFNQWAARCETLLRSGRHAADIAVVYPIDDLAARYHVGLLPETHGRDPIPGTDYYELSRILTGELHQDFTFLHPEVLDTRCRVEDQELVLDHPHNWERYRVLILPACRTIRVTNLKKAYDFLAAGGCVIATTCLPQQSVEFGRDAEVQRMVREMFGPSGKGIFVPIPDETSLSKTFERLKIAWDVRILRATEIPRVGRTSAKAEPVRCFSETYEGGNRLFAYQHRAVKDAEIYFFANSSDLQVQADVELRGRLRLEAWDPHTGTIQPLEVEHAERFGEAITKWKLSLPALRSVFVVGRAL